MFYCNSTNHLRIRKHALRLAVVMCGAASLVGCFGPRDIVVSGSEEDAIEVLTTALDAWKAGQKPDSLRSEDPPMYVQDNDWMDGRKLKAFEPREIPREHGGEWKVLAVLTLEGGGLPEEQKLVAYSVTTESHAVVITRSDDVD
jgi:hypothetical protein